MQYQYTTPNGLYNIYNWIAGHVVPLLLTCRHHFIQRREPITPVLKELHWLPVRQRISFKVLVLTYQALHGTAPQYMTDLLFRYQPTISLRSSDALLLTAPQSRLTRFGDRTFQHAAPRLWNGLPISLRSANNLNSFKKSSKYISFQGCLQRVMC